MQMDDGEILREYRAAKNQKEMVTILADQNLISPKEMAQWLTNHGAKVDGRLLNTPPKKEIKGPSDEIARLTDELERKEEVIKALNDMLMHKDNAISVLQERLKHMDLCKDVARTMAAMVGRMME